MSSDKTKNESNTSDLFESKLERLEAIVKKIEENANLNEELDLFEEGIKLAKECIEEYSRAEQKVIELTKQFDEILQKSHIRKKND